MVEVPFASLKRFCLDLLACNGVRSDVAYHVAEGLTQASLRGVDSHGVRLLPHYLRAVDAGRLNPDPVYRFQQTSAATGRLDGDHTFGHAAGAEGMGHAIDLARDSGMGTVAVYNSSHFGAAAYFSLMATQQDMIGLSFTHADALMLSYNGTRPFFGTNPICFAAPCLDEEPFCLDMATSWVTWNKVMQMRDEEGQIPEDWGVDEEGKRTQDPRRVTALYPIGGYKGYGLGMMVDILCALLTGMPVGRHLTRMYGDPLDQKRYLGHFFIALRIDCFVPLEQFWERMQQMMAEVRSEPSRDAQFGVQVPGDPEKRAANQRRLKGIPLSDGELEELRGLAGKHGLTFPVYSEVNPT